jgi:hypothetical protein
VRGRRRSSIRQHLQLSPGGHDARLPMLDQCKEVALVASREQVGHAGLSDGQPHVVGRVGQGVDTRRRKTTQCQTRSMATTSSRWRATQSLAAPSSTTRKTRRSPSGATARSTLGGGSRRRAETPRSMWSSCGSRSGRSDSFARRRPLRAVGSPVTAFQYRPGASYPLRLGRLVVRLGSKTDP